MSDTKILNALASKDGQHEIAEAIRDIGSFGNVVRAEEAANDAEDYANLSKDWAIKTDAMVEDEDYSSKYYALKTHEDRNDTADFKDQAEVAKDSALQSATTATQAKDIAISAKDDAQNYAEQAQNALTDINTGLASKADKSNTYTKTETDDQINTKLAELVASAPATLDTLEELANALGDDPNFATTVATQIGTKADKTYVDNKFNDYLPLRGGTMTGSLTSTNGLIYLNTKWAGIYNNKPEYDGSLRLFGGGGDAGGARLTLYGQNSNDGEFVIRASNGDAQKVFEGKSNGTLTWGGQNVSVPYQKRGNKPSITVPAGVYILVAYACGYSVPSPDIVYVGLIGGGDYNDGTQHIGVVNILKGSNYAGLGLTYSITTDGTKEITVSLTAPSNANISLIPVFGNL